MMRTVFAGKGRNRSTRERPATKGPTGKDGTRQGWQMATESVTMVTDVVAGTKGELGQGGDRLDLEGGWRDGGDDGPR